jgi:hypothetical protein
VTSGMTTADVVQALTREHARLMRAVDALGDDATTLHITEPGGWTARDVLAHLSHYCGMFAFGLGAKLTPPPYVVGVTQRLEPEQWNARAVAYWRTRSLDAVRAEFDRNVSALIAQVRLRTDEDMNTTDALPWAGTAPLWELIGGDTFLHEWPAHAAQMEQVLRRRAGAPRQP